MVPLGLHNIVEQQGTLPRLLPTTVPARILNMAFRFEEDPAEDAFGQNTGNMIKDADQVEVRGLPIGSVGYSENTYDYGTITRRSRRHRRGGL